MTTFPPFLSSDTDRNSSSSQLFEKWTEEWKQYLSERIHLDDILLEKMAHSTAAIARKMPSEMEIVPKEQLVEDAYRTAQEGVFFSATDIPVFETFARQSGGNFGSVARKKAIVAAIELQNKSEKKEYFMLALQQKNQRRAFALLKGATENPENPKAQILAATLLGFYGKTKTGEKTETFGKKPPPKNINFKKNLQTLKGFVQEKSEERGVDPRVMNTKQEELGKRIQKDIERKQGKMGKTQKSSTKKGNTPKKKGMGLGAKTGIGVGGGALALLFLGL